MIGYNLAGALSDFRPTLLSDIRLVLGVQIERTAELALGKPLKKGRKVGAPSSSIPLSSSGNRSNSLYIINTTHHSINGR